MIAFQLFAGLLCAFTAGQMSINRQYWMMALFIVLSVVNCVIAVGRIIS